MGAVILQRVQGWPWHPGGMIVDLSHVIRQSMVTYPGLPGPDITDHLSRADSRGRYGEGIELQIGRICMVGNTGTYVDVPFHFYENGDDLSATAIDRLVDLPTVLVHQRAGERGIGTDAFNGVDVAGKAVLLRTGWDRLFGTDAYGVDAPFLTESAVQLLVERGAALVGTDSVNIDDMGDLNRPAHSLLLGAGIPIVEHLRGMELLPADGFRFTAAPPMVAGMGTFPVRAFARLG